MSGKFVRLILAVLFCALIAGCSGGGEDEEEKGKIQQAAEQMGKDAAQAIKDPLNKARKAAALTEAHNKEVEEAQENQ